MAIFAALVWLTARRGAKDPVCGMKADKSKAVTKEFGNETFYFCSQHCLHAFETDPSRYVGADGRPIEQQVAEHTGHGEHGAHDH